MPIPAPRNPPTRFRVYVDESGDRGLRSRQSKTFILTALVVRDTDEKALRDARAALCESLGKPADTVLHWSQNIKSHPARREAATVLGGLPVILCYVIVDKASFRRSLTALGDSSWLYNYSARRLLERVSWLVRDQVGEAYVTFAHVKNFKYEPFHDYLTRLRGDETCTIHWPAISGTPCIDQPATKVLLQFADLAAGALAAAIVPDPYGRVECAYLDLIQHRLYRRPPGSILSYGLHVIGRQSKGPNCVTDQPWWSNFPNK